MPVRVVGVKRARDISFLNSKEGITCYKNVQRKKMFSTVTEEAPEKPSEHTFVKPSLCKKQESKESFFSLIE